MDSRQVQQQRCPDPKGDIDSCKCDVCMLVAFVVVLGRLQN